MRVDHRRSHIGMTQQLLHDPDIRSAFQQMGREGMAQRVTRDALREIRDPRGMLHRALQDGGMQMVTPTNARLVSERSLRRKHISPRPVMRRARILPLQCVRERRRTTFAR